MITSRDRFNKTMALERSDTDRVPYFEEGIRRDVLKAWYTQGLSKRTNLADLFPTDRFYEIAPEMDPIPPFIKWPGSVDQLDKLSRRLNENNKLRLPAGWLKKARTHRENGDVIFLRIHRGLFLSMGVYKWNRFIQTIELLLDNPSLVQRLLQIQAAFSARLAEKILARIKVDAVIFSEPIGGNEGPLISPDMYEDFMLAGFEPIFKVIRRHDIRTLILRTYANSRILIPKMLRYGINCLWACETESNVMDYRDLRQEFGMDLRLIGGIDLDVLRHGKSAIRKELESKIPSLIQQGGYIPLADGRVRSNIPFDNYRYYRLLLTELTTTN